jgi:hypothetical protein
VFWIRCQGKKTRSDRSHCASSLSIGSSEQIRIPS